MLVQAAAEYFFFFERAGNSVRQVKIGGRDHYRVTRMLDRNDAVEWVIPPFAFLFMAYGSLDLSGLRR